jgi:hypothetical protein
MRTRPGQSFIWQQPDVPKLIAFIKDNLDTALVIRHGDDLVAHRFPEQGNSDAYEIQLPAGTIDWGHTPASVTEPRVHPGNEPSRVLDRPRRGVPVHGPARST